MQCDLCGKETDELFEVFIEGSRLHVCKDCAKYGKIIRKIPTGKEDNEHNSVKSFKRRKPREEDKLYYFIDNFGKVVELARLKRGLRQKDLARMLGIKESLLHSIETSSIEPSVPLAKKIEKTLSVKIMQEASPVDVSKTFEDKHSSSLTLGDFVKVRKR